MCRSRIEWSGQVPTQGKRVLRIAFWQLERELPESVARAVERLRRPEARWFRIPLGVLSVVAGIFSFLPVLGIWMLPLGLLLLALDVPPLREPVGRFTIWATQKWSALRRWLKQRSDGTT
jgi:hypothetical protein